MNKSSDGSNSAEIQQQRQMDARSQAVTASTEVNQPQIKSRRPSETQSQSSTEPEHHHLSQIQSQLPSSSPAQSQTSSLAKSQPDFRVRSQPPSQPQSQVLPQSQFQTQPPLSSPADLHPQCRAHSQSLNLVTPAETARNHVGSNILQGIKSFSKYIKGRLQRLFKDPSDTNASLTRGVEEFRQDKANGLESRLQKLEGEQEQPGTPLSNRILTKHVTEQNTEEQDKELISEDNYARSYDHQVYKSKQQDRTTKVYKSKKIDHTTKSKHCCNSKKRVAIEDIPVHLYVTCHSGGPCNSEIEKNNTIEDYCFDDIVCKSKSTPKENMLQGSFSDEDIREFRKFSFNNRAATTAAGDQTSTCNINETTASVGTLSFTNQFGSGQSFYNNSYSTTTMSQGSPPTDGAGFSLVQSQNKVSSESHALGTLTMDMGSPDFTVSAIMPCQPEISMALSSDQVTLRCLDEVPGREATSASQSHELMIVFLSGENVDEKSPANTSAAEEILCWKQVPEKSETTVQSQNKVSSESHALGTLTMDMGSPDFTVSAIMPCQPEISMALSSDQVTLRCLDEVPGREATSASQSHELMIVFLSGENVDEKSPANTSAAEEILCWKQVPEKSETTVQSQNKVSSESHALGTLTMDMGSPDFTVSAIMPCQPEISMALSSDQVTLRCLDEVPGREATSASQSHELMIVFLSGENVDEKSPANTSAAEEILCWKQVPEKSETTVQSQNKVSSESHALGTLTMDMGSPDFTVSAIMPCQPEISMALSSDQVTLRCLDEVPGREATSASQSHELMIVFLSGENVDEKSPANTSAAEEILCWKQVPEKSETTVQSQNKVSSESHALGTLTMDMGSPDFTVSAIMPCQPEISMAHSSDQVTLRCLDEVPGREATSASQSHELMMVLLSGENADQKSPANTSAAEEILCWKQVPEKSEITVQSQNKVSSESHAVGNLTMDMGSPDFTVSAIMPCQPEISMALSSDQVTLRCLDEVPGREATSASQSHELMMVLLSGENADEKSPANTSGAEEILCRKQVPEKSEITVQSQNKVSSESHALGTLTMDMGSPDFTVSAIMPCQPEISMALSSDQVTLRCLDEVPGREATSASQSHELMMVLLSGENADEKSPANTSGAEEILCRKQVPEKSEITAVHGKEWTSYNKSFWSSDGKSQVDSEKWYLNFSQDHPCFSNGIIVFAVPFGTEPLPPRSYIVQNDYRYHYECVRLATFSQYQGSGFGTRLAQSGFVYDASRNMVVCPWDGSDVSSEIIRNRHGMSCAFVRQFYQINIPLHEAPSPPLPAAFAFDMAATITFSPATEEQLDRIQLQTETNATEVATREEPNQNAGSGLRQSSEGVNAADIGPIGSTEQEYFNNSFSLFLSNAALDGMISPEKDIDINCTVHQPENSNADAISGADDGASGGDSQIDLEELRENRILRYAELCIKCNTEPRRAVYLPCGHLLFCSDCARLFRKCFACKKLIQEIVLASFS